MVVANEKDLPATPVSSPEAKNAVIKALISPSEGWQGYVMRVIELGAHGYSPRHAHQWPHINYVLEGEGVLYMNGEDREISAGSYAYVPKGETHQYRNTRETPLRFICIVPEAGHVV